MQEQLERKGYFVPRAYQHEMARFCGDSLCQGLDHYWDEWAMEWMCSGGRSNPNLREFKREHTYRSSYLDELAKNYHYTEHYMKNRDLHPCFIYYNLRVFKDIPLALALTDRMEQKKATEIQRFDTGSLSWSGKKDTKTILHMRMEELGFKRKGKIFRKASSSGLVFMVMQDTGLSTGHIQLGLDFFISHETDEDWTFQVTLFERLVPGMAYYRRFDSPASAVLGIYALTDFFDLLTEAFSDPLKVV